MPSVPSPNPVIRRATVTDAAELTALGRRTFAEAFGADNTEENLTAFLDATYTVAQQEHELRDPALTCLVMECDGALVAFALLRSGRPSPFVADPTAIELQRFYVASHWHGSGVAQVLMARCLDEAACARAMTIFLGVWECNAKALRFYAAQGFEDVGMQIFQLGSDPQRDRVLARRITRRSSEQRFDGDA